MNEHIPKTIYLIRHGETEYNKQGIIQGGTIDAGLNETGILQARAFWNLYNDLKFEAVLTSRLKRTHQTVRHFLDSGIPWEQFAEINEMNWGAREGRPSTPELIAEYEEIKASWSSGSYDVRAHGGESASELFQRVSIFVDHIRRRQENLLLVCSHGRAMSAMISAFLAEPLSEMNKYRHDNTGLWVLRYQDETFRVVRENSTDHLINLL
ncbi:MAG TPA: histidine phosphatase family protein [Flavilitoribacter sp.]|nr:histidine phosphatase family protein [Flavilitoribacter sp.]HMQ91079.1 histidine phosphatase family protein [Flavilitoribacter sp.]